MPAGTIMAENTGSSSPDALVPWREGGSHRSRLFTRIFDFQPGLTLARPGPSLIIFPGNLIVSGDRPNEVSDRILCRRDWTGEEVFWKRSGSGSYREVSRIDIPQSRAEIEDFARKNRYVIEWRGAIPAQKAQAG